MMVQGFIPALSAPLKAQNAIAAPAKGNSASATGSTDSSSSTLQDTFLNLLITELQNQDPTSPVDPTAMVGQMVSLNQLDQLISINQTLQNLGTTSTATPPTSKIAKQLGLPTTLNTQAAAESRILPPGTSAANPLSQPNTGYADKASLMNLYGSFATPTSSALNSIISGGK